MLRRWVIVLLLLLIHACGSTGYKPEPVHPTWEQLEALSSSIQALHEQTFDDQPDVRLTVYPPLALAGTNVWVTCYADEGLGPGRIRWGVEGLAMSGPNPLERIEHRRLIERLPPGDWVASCDVWTWARHIRRTQPLSVQ